MKTSKSIVLKRNMKNFMISLVPILKQIVNKKIKQIKSRFMKKIQSNKKASKTTKPVKAIKNIIN